MYIKAKVLFKFGSLERLYVEMRPKKLPYNRKIWRKLNLVVWSQTYDLEILADFNLVERYSIVIRIYAQKKFWQNLIWW